MFVLGGLVCATWLSAQDYQKTAYGIKAAAGGVDVLHAFGGEGGQVSPGRTL